MKNKPANAFRRGNTIGLQTRFQPGNAGGPGRPRTVAFGRELRRKLRQPAGSQFWNIAAQLAEHFLWHALNGSVEHAKIIERHAGKRLWQEIQETTSICLENGYMLARRYRPKKVTVPAKSGENRAQSLINRPFSTAADPSIAIPCDDEPFSDYEARRAEEMRQEQGKTSARPV